MATPAGNVRSRTRSLLVQALYQAQLTGHGLAELKRQFCQRDEYRRVDPGFFEAVLDGVFTRRTELDALLARFSDRPQEQLDPVESAVLLIGLEELEAHPDTPYRVILDEAVSQARKYGAEDGHKFVNAVLDKAAAECRRDEYRRR